MITDKKKFIEEFELMRNKAELKALLDLSLIRQLTDVEFKRVMELKEVLL